MSRVHPADVYADSFHVDTRGRGLIDIGDRVRDVLANSGMLAGVAQVFVHHSSCSLLLGRHADPRALDELERIFATLVPDGDPPQGPALAVDIGMPARVRSMLAAVNVSIPLAGGELALGARQGLYLWEHRRMPRQRRLTVTLIGH